MQGVTPICVVVMAMVVMVVMVMVLGAVGLDDAHHSCLVGLAAAALVGKRRPSHTRSMLSLVQQTNCSA